MVSTVLLVSLPKAFDGGALSAQLAESVRVTMDAVLPEVLTEIGQSGTVPANLGVLTRAVVNGAQPAVVADGQVAAEIVVAGEAQPYAAVMDLGRRAGKPMSWRFLYHAPGQRGPDSWRGGWVNRARRQWVLEVAESLKEQDKVSGVKRGTARKVDGRRATSGVETAADVIDAGGRLRRRDKLRRETYERRACYLLSVSIASAIRKRGIKGRRFLADQRQPIAAKLTAEIEAEAKRIADDLSRGGA